MEPFPFFIPELGYEIGSRAEIDPHINSGLLFSGPTLLYRVFNTTRKTRNRKVKSSVECCGSEKSRFVCK